MVEVEGILTLPDSPGTQELTLGARPDSHQMSGTDLPLNSDVSGCVVSPAKGNHPNSQTNAMCKLPTQAILQVTAEIQATNLTMGAPATYLTLAHGLHRSGTSTTLGNLCP